jgi:hypothetical protein
MINELRLSAQFVADLAAQARALNHAASRRDCFLTILARK